MNALFNGIRSRSAGILAWWQNLTPLNRGFFLVVGAGLVLFIIISAVWKLPQWQVGKWQTKLEAKLDAMDKDGTGGSTSIEQLKLRVEQLKLRNDARKLENDARTTLVQALGGVVALAGIFFAWRTLKTTQKTAEASLQASQKTLELSRNGQIADRFTKAIEHLGAVESGKKKLEVRLGGIYALEGIAKESLDHYWPIMEVLTAYIRENASWPSKTGQQQPVTGKGQLSLDLPADIQAALTVLGRRTRTYRNGEDKHLNLTRTDLRSALLWGAHLEGAILQGAHLAGADLTKAHLAEAVLWGTNLMGTEGLTLEQLATVETLYDAKLNPSLLEEVKHKYPQLLKKQPWMVGMP
jgi:Pentapeptide repeats (8 copies)